MRAHVYIPGILLGFESLKTLLVFIIGKIIGNRSMSEIIFEDTPYSVIISVLNKLIKFKLDDEKIRKGFPSYKKKLVRASEYRNEVAHLGIGSKFTKDKIITFYTGKQSKELDTKTLQEYNEFIDTCILEGLSLLHKIRKSNILKLKTVKY